MKTASTVTQQFFKNLKSQAGFEKLFEFIPDIAFWAKNHRFEFMMGNQSVVERCGFREEDELIGKNDYEIFPKELADNFRRDDKRVIANREKILNRVELVPNAFGTVDWCITSKVPLFSKTGEAMGVAGTTKKIRNANYTLHAGSELSPVIEFISNNYMKAIDVGQLARISSLSVSHFGRKFKQVFGLPPSQYINKIRVKAACKALAKTHVSLASIARETGFSDQRYFSKQFKVHAGMHPNSYREKFYQDA